MLIPSKHSGYQAGIRRYPGGGKGGSSAPAPDPRLVAAQIKSMGYQDDAIQQLMENNKAMQPYQLEQLKFGLDTSKTAYEQSQADRVFALGKRDKLSGLQDSVVQQAKDFNEGDRAETLTNQAREGVAASYAQGQGMTNRALAARGISANSGAAIAALNGNGLTQSMNSAAAANMARDAARQEGYQLTDRASNALAGYPAMGMSTTGSGAGFGGAGLGYANSALSGMNGGQTAMGGMAGNMGSNATGMYGAQASYKNGQDQIAASNDPMNSILGAATGVGMSYAMGGFGGPASAGLAPMVGRNTGISDIRLKTDITRVGELDNGLPVYTFRYKSGGPLQMGVMAHEVKQVVPEAYLPGVVGGVYDAVDYSKLGA